MEKLPKKKIRNNILYAIKRRSDNKYSKGGAYGLFAKTPKTWGLGAFKNHLHIFDARYYLFHRDITGHTIVGAPFTSSGVSAADFPNRDFLIPSSFPYWDCDILEVDAEDFTILRTYDAPSWAWENCYKPHILKNNNRYLESINTFLKKHKFSFEL